MPKVATLCFQYVPLVWCVLFYFFRLFARMHSSYRVEAVLKHISNMEELSTFTSAYFFLVGAL